MSNRITRWRSLSEAREGLEALRRSGTTIGSVHTLGALHEGHGRVIRMGADQNKAMVVSVYPNIAQLPPGSKYEYDIDKDCAIAQTYGATHVITPDESEMYPEDYKTFFDQGEMYSRLDGTVTPYLFRGMITMSTRWIIFTRPTKTYWGLKDIGQVILVKQAVKDLMVGSKVVEVPCVRYKSGMAISSRMMNKPEAVIKEFNIAYHALQAGRRAILDGILSTREIVAKMYAVIESTPSRHFNLEYIKVALPHDFSEPETIEGAPVILQIVMSINGRFWFEGFYIRNEKELREGPETIWLDSEYPEFLA